MSASKSFPAINQRGNCHCLVIKSKPVPIKHQEPCKKPDKHKSFLLFPGQFCYFFSDIVELSVCLSLLYCGELTTLQLSRLGIQLHFPSFFHLVGLTSCQNARYHLSARQHIFVEHCHTQTYCEEVLQANVKHVKNSDCYEVHTKHISQ